MSVHGKLTTKEKGMVQGIALAVQIVLTGSGDYETANEIISNTGLTAGEMITSGVDAYDFDCLIQHRNDGFVKLAEHPEAFPLSDFGYAKFYKLIKRFGACDEGKRFVRRSKCGLKVAWRKCPYPDRLLWLAFELPALQDTAEAVRRLMKEEPFRSQTCDIESLPKRRKVESDFVRSQIPYDAVRRAIKSEYGI